MDCYRAGTRKIMISPASAGTPDGAGWGTTCWGTACWGSALGAWPGAAPLFTSTNTISSPGTAAFTARHHSALGVTDRKGNVELTIFEESAEAIRRQTGTERRRTAQACQADRHVER